MATTIRLTRMGKKKRPFYRLVAIDSRRQRDGAYLANLGYYNPFVEPYETRLHTEEILVWLKRGAVVSPTARALLRAQGVLHRLALEQQGLGSEEVAARMAVWQAGADTRAANSTAKLAARRQAVADAKAKSKVEAEGERAAAAAGAEAQAPGGEAGGESPPDAQSES